MEQLLSKKLKFSAFIALGIDWCRYLKKIASKTLFGHSILAKIVICFPNKLIYTFFQALLGILLLFIVVWHFPPRIVIMTTGLTTVPPCVKAPGGTTSATIPTWMVCTSTAARSVCEEWCGTTGKITTTLWRGLRWRYARKTFREAFFIKRNVYPGIKRLSRYIREFLL